MDFINARQFRPDDEEISMMRKKRLFLNIKVISTLITLGYITVFFYCISITPLTQSQLAMEFVDDQMYLFWLMYTLTFLSTLITSGVSIASNFNMTTILNFLGFEFEILANAFGKLLDKIDYDMSDLEISEILDEMKSYIKYHQRLLQ